MVGILICSGRRRVKVTTNGCVYNRILRGPGSILNLTANSAPLGPCNRVTRLCGGNIISFSGIAAFGLSRCIGVSIGSIGSCREFVRSGLFSGVGVPRSGVGFLGKGTTSLRTRYGGCRRGVGGTNKVSVRLLNVNSGNRVTFGRPTSYFRE